MDNPQRSETPGGQRCPTHGCWHDQGTFCPICLAQMNGGTPAKAAPLGDLPRAPVTPQGAPQVDDFGANDKPQAPPKPTGAKKRIGPEDVIWFGKHKGIKAKYVDPTYWVWAAENLAWLEVSQELLSAGHEAREHRAANDEIQASTVLWFGKCRNRSADTCPPDYIVWLAENTTHKINEDFLEDCRVEVEAGNR